MSSNLNLKRKLDTATTIDLFSLPESELLTQLYKLEYTLDTKLTKKLLAINNANIIPSNTLYMLNIIISSTYSHQIKDLELPNWILKIGGYITDKNGNKINNQKMKFSNFFNKIIIHLDPTLYPGTQSTIEWINSPFSAPNEGFEIKRLGSVNTNCSILFTINDDKLKVPEKLVIKGCEEVCTMSELIVWVYDYIRRYKLQDAADPTLIRCDNFLNHLLNIPKFYVHELQERLNAIVSKPEPISINYTVKVSGSFDNEEIYQVPLNLPDESHVNTTSWQAQLEPINTEMASIMTRAQHIRKKREFLLGYQESPLEVIKLMLASSARDANKSAIKKSSSYFTQEWVYDAVDRVVTGITAKKEVNK